MKLIKTINHHQRIIHDRYNALARSFSKKRGQMEAASALSKTITKSWAWYREQAANHPEDLRAALDDLTSSTRMQSFRPSYYVEADKIEGQWENAEDPIFDLLMSHPFTACLTTYAGLLASHTVTRPQALAYIANLVMAINWNKPGTIIDALGRLIKESENVWNTAYKGTDAQTTLNFYPVIVTGDTKALVIKHELGEVLAEGLPEGIEIPTA